jgi:hypothetical protein
LSYDRGEHKFEPNTDNLSEVDQDRVAKMLIVLGVNNDFIKMQRLQFLEPQLDYLEFQPEKVDTHQFPTAFAMIQRNPSR